MQRSIKRNINKRDGKGCPRCGAMLYFGDGLNGKSCVECGWMKKSMFRNETRKSEMQKIMAQL